MRKIWNKGHRIRASDKHLVYHFSIGTLLFVFVAVLLLLNIKQLITDPKSIEKYGGNKMYFAPPIDYDKVMKKVPYGKVITVGKIREHFAKLSGADFTEPITAGIFVSIVAWASYQRSEDETPYWRTLKANGELNAKYPNGIEAQKEKLEAEGHTIIQKGRKNIRYYVKDYENSIFDLK